MPHLEFDFFCPFFSVIQVIQVIQVIMVIQYVSVRQV